jgi:serine protease Do
MNERLLSLPVVLALAPCLLAQGELVPRAPMPEADKREGADVAGREARMTPVARVVRDVAPAVVHIRTELPRTPIADYFGMPTQVGSGSGVIVDPEGYVVTNGHVVRGAQKIHVYLQGDKGEHPYPGELVDADAERDLALLKIERKEPFPYVKFCTDELIIGETVIAIGNPTGMLADTVTTGVLSAVNRDVPIASERRIFKGLIQTDAAINPGNSGGPLLNVNGELIGINQAVAHAQNIGFAIPASAVEKTLNERLLNADRTHRFWLGMRVESSAGALHIRSVDASGPAARGGVQLDDVLLEVDGKEVTDDRSYAKAILAFSSGEEVTLKVRRGRSEREVHLRLLPYDDRVIWERLGITVREELVGKEQALRVESVDRSGPAAGAKLRPDDVLFATIVKVPVGDWFGTRIETRRFWLDSKQTLRQVLENLSTKGRASALPVRVLRDEEQMEGEIPLR